MKVTKATKQQNNRSQKYSGVAPLGGIADMTVATVIENQNITFESIIK